MDGLLVGFDLCDTYTQVCVFDEVQGEPVVLPLAKNQEEGYFGDIPTVICKCRRRDEWRVGREALKTALESDGIMVDKLVRLVRKDGMATLEDITYSAKDLLKIYIQKILEYVSVSYENKPIMKVVFTLRILDFRIIDCILNACKTIGLLEDDVKVIGHSEGFLYYLLNQKTENYANIASLFDLSEEGLTYMECRVHRGVKPQICQIDAERLEEGFDVGILEASQGMKLADNIISSCAERLLSRKIISSVWLSGKGFEKVNDWGNKSLPVICNRRKTFYEGQIFAKGAAFLALDLTREVTAYPYLCVCEGRLACGINMQLQIQGVSRVLPLITPGTRWYQAKSDLEFLLDDMDSVDLTIVGLDPKKQRQVKVELTSFPVRPNKTTRVHLSLSCLSEDMLHIVIEDMGFGKLFPASDAVVERDIPLLNL